MKDVIIKAEPLKLKISHLGFCHYARNFFDAAELIEIKGGFNPVPYYLYCHSLELSLKALLLDKGDKIHHMRELGHNIDRILGEVEKSMGTFVRISKRDRGVVSKINQYYNSTSKTRNPTDPIGKGFEYFTPFNALSAFHQLPHLDDVKIVARKFLRKAQEKTEYCKYFSS